MVEGQGSESGTGLRFVCRRGGYPHDNKSHRVQENLIAYNAAISACEHMLLWQAAVHLLQEAQASAITPDALLTCAMVKMGVTLLRALFGGAKGSDL